jgi:hypothetical protein
MANLVKSYIFLKLLESTLAPNFLEHVNVLKDDLGHDQLGLPVILGIHVSPFTSDVSHTVIVGDCQLLKIPQ